MHVAAGGGHKPRGVANAGLVDFPRLSEPAGVARGGRKHRGGAVAVLNVCERRRQYPRVPRARPVAHGVHVARLAYIFHEVVEGGDLQLFGFVEYRVRVKPRYGYEALFLAAVEGQVHFGVSRQAFAQALCGVGKLFCVVRVDTEGGGGARGYFKVVYRPARAHEGVENRRPQPLDVRAPAENRPAAGVLVEHVRVVKSGAFADYGVAGLLQKFLVARV